MTLKNLQKLSLNEGNSPLLLTESLKLTFESVLLLEDEIKMLQAKANAAREEIRKFLVENNATQLKQDGYYANIAKGTRDMLQSDEVAKLLGHEIPDSCYKHTHYTTLTIKRIEKV